MQGDNKCENDEKIVISSDVIVHCRNYVLHVEQLCFWLATVKLCSRVGKSMLEWIEDKLFSLSVTTLSHCDDTSTSYFFWAYILVPKLSSFPIYIQKMNHHHISQKDVKNDDSLSLLEKLKLCGPNICYFSSISIFKIFHKLIGI